MFQAVEARARISALVPQGLSCWIELLGEQMVLLELAAGRHRKVRDDVAARWLHFGNEALRARGYAGSREKEKGAANTRAGLFLRIIMFVSEKFISLVTNPCMLTEENERAE